MLRLHIPLRIAPSGITPVLAGQRLVGRALPVTHFGSVDLFLEATQLARPGDVVLAADDGCLFVTAERFEGIFAIARAIWQRERHQAEAIVDGETLGESWRLPTISRGEPSKPSYTFREHLRKIKNAIEE